MRTLLNLFIIFLLSSACVEKEDLRIKPGDEKVVVEGRITNTINKGLDSYFYNYLLLSKTTSLDSKDTFQYAFDTKVSVTYKKNGGKVFFEQRGRNTFIPANSISIANPGDTIDVTVELTNGMVYTAQDIMPSPCKIDSLYVQYLLSGDAYAFSPEGYYIHMVFTDEPSQKNYYRYNFIGESYNNNERWLLDDKFMGAKPATIIIPYFFESSGSKVIVELQSLSFKAYEYHRQLSLSLNNDGGFFSTPPANPVSNVSNGSLGFFMACQVSRDTVVVP